jgi:ribosomal protein L11 methyltransferase
VGADPAVRLSVPTAWSEMAGAVLFDLLGPFQELEAGERRHLVFYPFRHGAGFVPDADIRAALPADPALQGSLQIERVLVPGGWEEGWRSHFKPLQIGRLYIRPPWEERAPTADLIELVLTPGLAFGTGLHPTTRGMLELLQDVRPGGGLTDAGTGSGILAIAAARLGYRPVRAFDNDPQAVEAAKANAAENSVTADIETADLSSVPTGWFAEQTVLANLTLEPVLLLLDRLTAAGTRVRRLLLAGILKGDQERQVVTAAMRAGLRPVARIYDKEWVCSSWVPELPASH